MISLQRKLAIKVRDQVYKDGDAPKHISQGQAYPVIGYSVQMREKEKDGAKKSYEEIAVFLVVNNNLNIGYVYPSYCDIFIDPFQEEICNSEFIKEGSANNATGKDGQK